MGDWPVSKLNLELMWPSKKPGTIYILMHVLTPHLQVLEVQVGLVLVGGFVSAVTVGDDGVQQILEDLVGLLVTSNAANGHDEGVALGAGGRMRKLVTLPACSTLKIVIYIFICMSGTFLSSCPFTT